MSNLPAVKNEWNASLCHCCNDCGICCYGFWCTPCLFGSNYEKVDKKKNCCLMCCLYGILANFYLCWIPHYFERQSLREKYNLKEDPCDDCLTALCCGPCALCQEAREMKSRDPQQNVGFQANNNNTPVVMQPGVKIDPAKTGGLK